MLAGVLIMVAAMLGKNDYKNILI
jgi:hypothetical protein